MEFASLFLHLAHQSFFYNPYTAIINNIFEIISHSLCQILFLLSPLLLIITSTKIKTIIIIGLMIK